MPAPTAAAPRCAGSAARSARTFAVPTVLALLIAALGLLVATSTSLTTNAAASGPVASDGVTPRIGVHPGPTARAVPARSANRTPAVRVAVVREVAAQRSDRLARQAEAAGRSARDAAGTARQDRLTRTERSSQATAAQIAARRLAQAEAARSAAEERAAAADAEVARAHRSGDGTANPSPTKNSPTNPASADVSAADTGLPAGAGVLPVPAGVVGAVFGARGSWSSYHTGLDFRAGNGTPIRSVLAGVVLYAGSSGDWSGNHVAVRHAGGQTTMYSHMSSITAQPGQRVRAGQVIGYVGETGRAFGAHLHFELYPAGVRYGDVYRAVDPGPWLRSVGVRTR